MDGSSGQFGRMVSAVPNNYVFGRTLGKGSSGKVDLALHVATREQVAVKILDRSKLKRKALEEKVEREIKILRSLSHPHIVRQYEVLETADKVYVVMEHASRDLFDYIVKKVRLLEDEARRLFQQIISGVDYCHRNKIVHRDLKPENVLLDSEMNIKIADFGLSNVMEDGHLLKTSCGTPNYTAPEIISLRPYSGPEVDIWSCGVMLYVLLCGILPFDDQNIAILFHKIKRGQYTLPNHLSSGARDLIQRMLVVDPLMRIRISEIRQHPWFNNSLPPYLFAPPTNVTEQINEEIVQKVVNMGFNGNHVMKSLVNRIQNQATVTYNLLLDSKSKRKSREILGTTLIPRITLEATSHASAASTSQARTRPQTNVEKKLTLGFQAQACPVAIMYEVSRALLALKVCWKHNGEYNFKCLWNPSFVNDECAILFELQLYKGRQGRFLLDIQKVDGSPFIYYNFSVDLLTELGVL